MAEAVFKEIVRKNNLQDFQIDSCGTANYHVGDTPDSRSVATCKRHGVPVNHRGRQLNQQDFTKFQWILCMDDSNLSNILRAKPSSLRTQQSVDCNIKLFGEFDSEGDRIIDDPYYGSDDGFEHNFNQVVRSSIGFLKHLGFTNIVSL